MKTKFFLLVALFALVSTTVSAQRVAVLDFNAGVGVSQADVDGISAIFNTYFSPRGYTLVERTQIDRVIDEQNFQRGKLTQSQMVRVGQILNVSKVVIGDVNIVMNQYNVDVRVVNVESGTIAAKDGATWAPGSSYRTMMSQLGSRLAGKIAISATSTSYVQHSKIWKVGDIYNVNGKTGVVFAVSSDGQRGKIVSLEEAILDQREAEGWCRSLGRGWRMPTSREIVEISSNWSIVNEGLSYAEGEQIKNGWYWSSDGNYADNPIMCYITKRVTDRESYRYRHYVRAVCVFTN